MKKNETFYFVMAFVMGFLFSGFGTWAIIEFILYLVKDNPFNWLSLWLTIAAAVLEVYFFIRTIMSD